MLSFALENRKIHHYNISDFMKQFLSKNDINTSYDRLIGHHGVKSHYMVSGENLQLYLKNGLEIIKVHCGYKFDQEAFLQSYINKNIESRKMARNDFEKDIQVG